MRYQSIRVQDFSWNCSNMLYISLSSGIKHIKIICKLKGLNNAALSWLYIPKTNAKYWLFAFIVLAWVSRLKFWMKMSFLTKKLFLEFKFQKKKKAYILLFQTKLVILARTIACTHSYLSYILKRKRNATVLNPLFLLHGPHEANFLIISCVHAHWVMVCRKMALITISNLTL